MLLGDIVGSSKIDPVCRDEVLGELKACLQDSFFRSLDRNPGYEDSQRFRGDSFQIAFKFPEFAMHGLLALRSRMKQSFDRLAPESDLRLVLGIGTVGGATGDGIGSWDGPAFRFAARAMEAMERESRRLRIHTAWDDVNSEMMASCSLLDVIQQRWSREQSAAILGVLRGKLQTMVAREEGVGQSAIAQRLSSAGWPAVRAFLARFEFVVRHTAYQSDAR